MARRIRRTNRRSNLRRVRKNTMKRKTMKRKTMKRKTMKRKNNRRNTMRRKNSRRSRGGVTPGSCRVHDETNKRTCENDKGCMWYPEDNTCKQTGSIARGPELMRRVKNMLGVNIILIVDLYENDTDDIAAVEACLKIFSDKKVYVYDNILNRIVIGDIEDSQRGNPYSLPIDEKGTVFILSGMHDNTEANENTKMISALVENYNFVFQNSCDFVEKAPRVPEADPEAEKKRLKTLRDHGGLPSNVRANKYEEKPKEKDDDVWDKTKPYVDKYKTLMDKLTKLNDMRVGKGLFVHFTDYPRKVRNVVIEQYSLLASDKTATKFKKIIDPPIIIQDVVWNQDKGKFVPNKPIDEFIEGFVRLFPATTYSGYPEKLATLLSKKMDGDSVKLVIDKVNNNYEKTAAGKYGVTALADLFCVLSVAYAGNHGICSIENGKCVVTGSAGNLISELQPVSHPSGFNASKLIIESARNCLDTYFKTY